MTQGQQRVRVQKAPLYLWFFLFLLSSVKTFSPGEMFQKKKSSVTSKSLSLALRLSSHSIKGTTSRMVNSSWSQVWFHSSLQTQTSHQPSLFDLLQFSFYFVQLYCVRATVVQCSKFLFHVFYTVQSSTGELQKKFAANTSRHIWSFTVWL